ncbi:hypothetical protein [Nonomuraea sp. NPDC050786]|uniref:hypothetical protein n=1 Tax=Nonomuraea sp. NPDC050786 TaxID=3154840 RepID=UPI0033E91449
MKVLYTAAATILLIGGGGVAYAVASATPTIVGVCANKTNGGYLRLLEAKNSAKSQYGKCRKNEVKIPLATTAAKGARGASAYEVWRDYTDKDGKQPNKTKTVNDYLASLQGRGFDGAPFNITFTGNGPWTCSWQATTGTLACVTPTS